MFNFSFAMIMKNEAKHIPIFLNSIKYFLENGGNCVIVDTGSTDGSAEIARGLGAIVYEAGDRFKIKIDSEYARKINEHFIVKGEALILKDGDSIFDFASARNYASSLTKHSINFSPDCDEIWTKFNYGEVIRLIKSGIELFEYNFVFAHDQFGAPTISFMHSKAFDKRKLKWVGVVHEVLQGEAKRQYVGEDILKLEHYQNEQTNRSGYLKGLAVDCYEHPENDRNSHYLGRELLWTGHPESAIKELQRHTTLGGWHAERAQSHVYIGEAQEQLGRDKEALASYFEAYTIEGNMREPLMKIAEYYFNRQDWRRTITFCESMLSIPQGGFYASQTENYTHKPHHLLYVAYWQLGNRVKSEEHFWKAYNHCPLHAKYLFDMRFYKQLPKVSIICPTLGRPEGLERLKRSIDSLNYPKELIETIIIEDSPRLGVPKRVREGFEKSTGEMIVFVGNDCEFEPDSLIIATKEMDELDLGAFNSGNLYPDQGNICEHFIVKKEFVNKSIGDIFDTDFDHYCCDSLLWAKANKYGKAKRIGEAKITHHHYSRGAEFDEVYQLATTNIAKDREILKHKLSELGLNS